MCECDNKVRNLKDLRQLYRDAVRIYKDEKLPITTKCDLILSCEILGKVPFEHKLRDDVNRFDVSEPLIEFMNKFSTYMGESDEY